MIVTAEDVICGDGLFDNRWLKYMPDDNGQFIYLQPASLDAQLQLSEIELGEYRIGVKLSGAFESNPDKIICLAYPGPSVPVEILCMEKVE